MPLDFEIYGGQDEKSIDGDTGIFIKKIKESSSLQRTVQIGDHILKVRVKRKIINTTQHVETDMTLICVIFKLHFSFLHITVPSSMNLRISWLKFLAF